MKKLIQDLIEMISKDNLRGALELLSKFCIENRTFQDLEIEVHSVLGRLSRIETDRRNGVIPVNQFYENLNQIRINILSIIRRIEDPSHSELKYVDKIAPILESGIEKSNQLINQNRRLDLIYKILLFSILFAGFGILLFSIGTERILEEKIYLGSISMTGIFSSLYFYTRLRGIEIMKYGQI